MTDFQRKLHRYVGDRAVMAVAHEVGVDPSTLQRWLGGQAPTLNGLKTLAKGSGVPVAYWADELVPILAPGAVERGTAPAGLAKARLGPAAAYEPDAADPRALVMPDDSMSPMIERGHVVIYDAGRRAGGAGGLVVTRVGKGLTVRRRAALGKGWVHLAADASSSAAASPEGEAGVHPVVAIVMKPRRVSVAPQDRVCDPAPRVAEDDPPYGN